MLTFEPRHMPRRWSRRPITVEKRDAVLKLKAEGRSNDVIARDLRLSARTVARVGQRWGRPEGTAPESSGRLCVMCLRDLRRHDLAINDSHGREMHLECPEVT